MLAAQFMAPIPHQRDLGKGSLTLIFAVNQSVQSSTFVSATRYLKLLSDTAGLCQISCT